MSIVESLKKLVDPIRARQEEVERRAERERPSRDVDAGPPPKRHRCRVCGHEDTAERFCPHCLAETMRAI